MKFSLVFQGKYYVNSLSQVVLSMLEQKNRRNPGVNKGQLYKVSMVLDPEVKNNRKAETYSNTETI